MRDEGRDQGVLVDERPIDLEAVVKAFEQDDRPMQIVIREDWLAKESGQMFEVLAIVFLIAIGFAQFAFTLM